MNMKENGANNKREIVIQRKNFLKSFHLVSESRGSLQERAWRVNPLSLL
jgi:hypothetical protein